MNDGQQLQATCPACEDPQEKKLATRVNGVDFLLCANCGHQFALLTPADDHLSEVYSDGYFATGDSDGDGYANYLSEQSRLVDRGRSYAKVLERFIEPGRLLDVGCGAGFYMQGLHESGWECEGVEPNAKMAEIARQNPFIVHHGGFEQTDSLEGTFDCVFMVQVAAHFTAPNTAFAKAAQLLRPGGILVVETWDGRSLTARTLRGRWHEYNPPSVLNIFSRRSLRTLLQRNGLKEEKSKRIMKTVAAGHAANLLSGPGASPTSKFAAHFLGILPESLGIPYPADDLFWSIFSKPNHAAA